MLKKTERRGSGMTVRTITTRTAETVDDVHELFDAMCADPFRELRKIVDDILNRAGLPCRPPFAIERDGIWRPMQPGDPVVGVRYWNQIADVADLKGYAPDSGVGFAARCADRLWRIDGAKKARRIASGTVMDAFQLGMLYREAQIKFTRERTWMNGVGAIATRQKAAATNRKKAKIEDVKILEARASGLKVNKRRLLKARRRSGK